MPISAPEGSSIAAQRVRACLLWIFLFALAGTAAELLLLEHTEGFWQQLPLWLMGVSLASCLASLVARGPRSLRIFLAGCLLLVASGFVGLVQHFRSNIEFELEIYPSLAGGELYWQALKGAVPTLAPGAMIVLGLLGWVYAYWHPGRRGWVEKNSADNGEP